MHRLYKNLQNILYCYITFAQGKHMICTKYWLSLEAVCENRMLCMVYKPNSKVNFTLLREHVILCSGLERVSNGLLIVQKIFIEWLLYVRHWDWCCGCNSGWIRKFFPWWIFLFVWSGQEDACQIGNDQSNECSAKDGIGTRGIDTRVPT